MNWNGDTASPASRGCMSGCRQTTAAALHSFWSSNAPCVLRGVGNGCNAHVKVSVRKPPISLFVWDRCGLGDSTSRSAPAGKEQPPEQHEAVRVLAAAPLTSLLFALCNRISAISICFCLKSSLEMCCECVLILVFKTREIKYFFLFFTHEVRVCSNLSRSPRETCGRTCLRASAC